MPDLSALSRLIFAVAVFCVAQGCVNTSYHHVGEEVRQPQFSERRVDFWLNDRVFSRAYSCVFLVPATQNPSDVRSVAERAFQRHLSEKFDRVIPGHSVNIISNRQFIEIRTPDGVTRFAKKMDCAVSASVRVREIKNDFLMFYARKSLKLEVRLTDTKNKEPLWRASHNASRGDGSLPISPLSAVSSVVRASRLSADEEQFASIVDDAIRRMARTLPSFRLDSREIFKSSKLNRG